MQDSYNIDQPEAFAGLIGDSGFTRKETGLAEGVVDFGLGLIAGTDAVRQVKIPSSPGGEVRGISIHQHVEQAQVTGIAQYKDEDAVDVMRRGLV